MQRKKCALRVGAIPLLVSLDLDQVVSRQLLKIFQFINKNPQRGESVLLNFETDLQTVQHKLINVRNLM